MRRAWFPFSIVALAVAAACGGGGSGPTAPSTTVGQPSLTVAEIRIRQRQFVYSWGAIDGATEYVLEVGTTPGGSNIATVTTSATTATVGELPAGTDISARVRARGATGLSAASTEHR